MTTREYVLSRTREKIAEVYNLLPPVDASLQVTPEDVRNVTVILGSSRSGSSYLFSLLAESGAFWSPQGEETPFYRLADLGWVENDKQSDAIAAPWDLHKIHSAAHRLLLDVGRSSKDTVDKNIYAAQAAARLIMQWPALDLNPSDVMTSFLFQLEKAGDGTQNPQLWHNWLKSSGIDPHLYALDGFAPRAEGGFEFPEFLIEEPPFIAQKMRQVPRPADLQNGALLLKSSSNAYRLPLLRALFPNARFKWIVLTRNPAASISGLMDGWLSGAFHSHHVGEFKRLKIAGYTDVVPNGENWWKFDLPPGWCDFAGADLSQVCAFQWQAAYQNIFAHMEQTGDPLVRVKYEDLAQPDLKAKVLSDIFSFTATKPLLTNLPSRPVMASESPRSRAGGEREGEIISLLKNSSLTALAEKLNYDLSRPEKLP